MTQLAPLHDSPAKAKEAALQAFNLARRVHQAAQFAQPMARLEAAVSEAEAAAACLTTLAETLKAEIGRIMVEAAEGEPEPASAPAAPRLPVRDPVKTRRAAAKRTRPPVRRQTRRTEARLSKSRS